MRMNHNMILIFIFDDYSSFQFISKDSEMSILLILNFLSSLKSFRVIVEERQIFKNERFYKAKKSVHTLSFWSDESQSLVFKHFKFYQKFLKSLKQKRQSTLWHVKKSKIKRKNNHLFSFYLYKGES